MRKSILFPLAALLAFANVTSADIVFDGGVDGTGTDFFAEANWIDTVTGTDPGADTINPNPVVIASNLTIGGNFNVAGATTNGNIRLADGLTLTLEDNATLFSQVFSAPSNAEFNIVLTDNSELTVTQNIARTAFDISGDADLILTGGAPEFATDSLNLASSWTGSITVNRDELQGTGGTGLFENVTIDGASVTAGDISSTTVGGATTFTLTNPTAVPEPSSLVALSLTGLLVLRRRK